MNKPAMFKIVITLILLAALGYVIFWMVNRNILNKPESIAYDTQGKRFLISNSGNGQILTLNEKGKYDVLIGKGLDNPRGLKLIYPFLYAADNKKIRVIDVPKARIVDSIPIAGSIMLNDIESDNNGLLYISDTQADKLFILDPATKKAEPISSALLKKPNGIVFDAPRSQMFIVSYTKGSSVLALDIRSRQVSVFMPSIYDNLDGIAIDDLGRIYFSSWGEKAIFMIPQEQNRTLLWQKDLVAPADIYYHKPTNEILVPLYDNNEIKRFKAE
jgi:sugar lactone lactonase YvrE